MDEPLAPMAEGFREIEHAFAAWGEEMRRAIRAAARGMEDAFRSGLLEAFKDP